MLLSCMKLFSLLTDIRYHETFVFCDWALDILREDKSRQKHWNKFQLIFLQYNSAMLFLKWSILKEWTITFSQLLVNVGKCYFTLSLLWTATFKLKLTLIWILQFFPVSFRRWHCILRVRPKTQKRVKRKTNSSFLCTALLCCYSKQKTRKC